MAIQAKYEEQLNRVRRWYERFSKLDEGILQTGHQISIKMMFMHSS